MVLASTHADGAAVEAEQAAALHERLVAYVQALGARAHHNSGVWVEHSYARASGGAGWGPGGAVRELLPRAPSPPPADVDVCACAAASPVPGGAGGAAEPEPEEDEGEWEARLEAAAAGGGAGGARAARAALAALRDLRLARLAAAGAPASRATRRDQVKRAAIRLRLALAPLWARGGAGGAGAGAGAGAGGAAWLQGLVAAHAPRAARALWDALLAELARGGLARRLLAPPPPPPPDPSAAVGPEVGPEASGVWVAWAGGPRRLVRRLRARLHVRVLRGPGAGAPSAAPPDAWAAAAVTCARQQLDEILAEAGPRAVVLAGCGAGASLCALLAGGAGAGGAGGASAGGARVHGLALLAPPLLTPEGAYCPDDADDPLAEVRVPVLMVVGAGGAAGAAGAGRAGAARRVVALRGADAALRLPLAHRAALRLPQHALDAAVVEEVVRFAREVAERDAADVRGECGESSDSDESETETEGDYAHLPPFSPATAAPPTQAPPTPALAPSLQGARADSGDAERSRGGGGAGAVPLRPADILHLPIVFADDPPAAPPAGPSQPPAPPSPERTPEPAPAPAADEPVTVTSGARGGAALKYTRVIVAKRGAARPLVLRRALPRLRLVPAPAPAPAPPGAAAPAAGTRHTRASAQLEPR